MIRDHRRIETYLSEDEPRKHVAETFRPEKDPSMPERFWKFVDKSDGCWLWSGGAFKDGYGQIWAKDKRYVRAHRASWLLHFGEIPPDMQVCHTCDTPLCVRPDHLFLGTNQDNSDDCRAKGRHSQAEKHYKAKLTPDQVREIVERYRIGGTSQLRLALEYGVSEGAVHAIVTGKSWKALGLPVIVQTPGRNGEYIGPCRVRHLPPGVMGREGAGFLDGWASEARKRGGFKSLQRRKPREARAARKPYQYVPRAPKPYKPPLQRNTEV